MIDPEQVVKLVGGAGRLVGLHELSKAGGFHPGEQTALKRVLRELVKQGRLVRDGKRYGLAGEKPTQRSGPAWGGQRPAAVRAKAGVAPKLEAPRGRFRRAFGEGFVAEPPKAQPPPAPRPPKKAPPAPRTPRGRTVKGIIHHHRDGFAFVKPIVGETSEDLFIPPEEARKALDHDQVLVEVVPGRAGRSMGRVVEVLSRTRQLVVGTYFEDGRGAWVEPREQELGSIRVPKTQLARPGDAVKVRLGVGEANFADADRLTGEVSGSLGAESDHSVEVLSVAFAKGFHDEFPPEVMDEADLVPLGVSAAEAKGEKRRDLRAMPLITIDGEDARDFDDAVYAEAHPRGWRLVVAIADVSHYVQPDTALDQEALRRATSVYLPGRVLPMLPERLSNGTCSLKPDEDRLCMVADMVIDRQGQTQASEIYPAVMRSHARCTYTEVHRVLAGEHLPGRTELKPLFERLLQLSKALTAMRLARGAIDFDLPERKVVLNAEGLPDRLEQRERLESHRLIEECMLAANEAVARFFREQQLPTVNRYHGEPDEERLAMFLTLLGAYGIEVPPGDFTSRSLNEVLQKLEGHPEQRALNQLALRSMMQAVYSSQQAGHYGLGAEDYLHFTSPIRRYPDLLVHRLLKHLWARGKKRPSEAELEEEEARLEVLAVQCSERERAAMQVEREVNQLYSCLLLKEHLGEEFDGAVCGLADGGFFVQLDQLWVEGFVRGETVYPDFEFDQATYRLTFGDGRVVRVGQRCRVLVLSINLERKQIDYELLSLEGEAVEAFPMERASRGRTGRPVPPARFGTARRGAPGAGGGPRGRLGDRSEGRGAGPGREGAMRGGRFGGREAARPTSSGGRRTPSGGPSRGRDAEREGRFGIAGRGAPGGRAGLAETGPGRERERRGGALKGRERTVKATAPEGARGRFGPRAPAPEARPLPGREGFERLTSGRGGPQGAQGRRAGERARRPPPPPQPWEKREEPAEEAPKPFDARSVLDRLWRERGGGKKR